MTTGEFEYGNIVFGTEENPDDPTHQVCHNFLTHHLLSNFTICFLYILLKFWMAQMSAMAEV